MARVLKGSRNFTCTPRLHPQRYEPYLPLPSQPKLVLIYPTPEGWKAELALTIRTIYKTLRAVIADGAWIASVRGQVPALTIVTGNELPMLKPTTKHPMCWHVLH